MGRLNLKLRLLLIALFVSFLSPSCDKRSTDETHKKTKRSDSFLKLFPTIAFNNLHVYSPFDDNPDGDKFKGAEIDTTYHKYFSQDEWLYNALRSGSEVFSCYKFALNDSTTGLIVRMPSQYEETRIALCIWDNTDQRLVKTINLADAFGDGMWSFVQDGWITDVSHDGSFDIVTRKMEWWEEDTDETDVNSKTFGAEHVSDSFKVYVGRRNDFVLSDLTIDTTTFKVQNR